MSSKQLKKRKKNKNNRATVTPQTTGSPDKKIIVQEKSVVFSGPIPEPGILEKYNRILPGAADRILTMAEKDATHVREREIEIISYSYKYRLRGQILGFAIGLFALFAAGFCAYLGQQVAASLIGVSGVAGLVGAFLKSSGQKGLVATDMGDIDKRTQKK